MTVRIRTWLVCLAAVAAMGGCARGGGDSSDEDGLPPQATPTPAPFLAAPGEDFVADASQSALAAIRQRGAWRVGVLYNNPPFSQLTDGGNLAGFEVSLVQAIAEAWGVDVDFVQVTRQTGLDYLLSGDVDVLATATPHRRDLHQFADFSLTTFRSGFFILAPEASAIESVADLDGQPVAIVEYQSFEALGEASRELGIAPTAQQFETTRVAVEELLDGRVAAVVGRREELMLETQSHPDLSIRGEPLALEPYAFAVRRGDANFRNLLDVSLQSLVASGVYAELFSSSFYGYSADDVLVWPGEGASNFGDQSTEMLPPAESVVARIARGDPLVVAGLQSSYDDPNLDAQRLMDAFSHAVVNEFARRWGVQMDELSETGGVAGIAEVAAGQADLAVGVVPNRALPDGADFSQPYVQRGLRLAHLSTVEVTGFDDLDGHTMAVLASEQDAQLLTENNTGLELVDVTSPRHALSLLQAGEATIVLADEHTVGLLAREDPNVAFTEEVINPVPFVVAVPRYDSDFLALVNFTLQGIYADGTLARLTRQYFGPYAPPEVLPEPYPVEVWPGSASYLGLASVP